MKSHLVLGRILLIESNREFFMKLPRVFFDSDGVDRATLVHVFEDWSTCISILFVVLFDILGGFLFGEKMFCFVWDRVKDFQYKWTCK